MSSPQCRITSWPNRAELGIPPKQTTRNLFLGIHLKSISKADEIRPIFNKIIYQETLSSSFCKGLSLLPHSNYSCYGTFIALFYWKVFWARGKEATVGIGRNAFPQLGAAQLSIVRCTHESKKKKPSFSTTRNWRQLEAIGEISGVMYLLIAQVTDYDAFWEDRVEPPSPPLSCLSLGASHAFIATDIFFSFC